jgi:hypothetical protein
MDYERWCAQTIEELGEEDIAAVSLACAVGLPGSENLQIPACLARLDEWTDRVRLGIENALRNRPMLPEYDHLSESEYRIVTMFFVLYRHLGVTCNLDCQDPTKPFDGRDSRIHFIHAVLTDRCPVTCCTAPVVVASIGGRLGYPIKLVKAREHILCRWDDPNGVRFNIEATDQGYHRKTDEYYHNWPKPVSADTIRVGGFLVSLNPRQDLSVFLNLRGVCLLENLRLAEAEEAFYYSCQVDQGAHFHFNYWKIATLIRRAQQASPSRDPAEWRIPTPGKEPCIRQRAGS